ncbi:hypothetical protein Tco_0768059 [Tanacetum coccineum]
MMTYLKHVGNKKHSDLKNKTFEEIQALYEKVKRFDESFTAIGSTEDERKIKEMNEGASDPDKKEKFVKEDVSTKVPAKQDEAKQGTKKRKGGHMKMLARKRKRLQPDVDSDDEHRKCLKITDQAEHIEEINQNVVIRSNGQKRYFSTLMRVLSIFDREDLNAVYQLVMNKYQDEIPEGFDRVLWGDLVIMFNPDDENEFWNQQLDWTIVSWKLHSSSGVHTLVTETGLVIHMLVEKKYPLRKEVLMKMLNLKLESEEDSTMALELIRHKNWLVHKQTACGKDFSNPFMVDNLPKNVGFSTHLASMVKSWLVHDQTVHGKDKSNMLIPDSLLKTIWFINAPCYGNEALASPKANELTIPEQTATGKGTSNPLMAGGLPKTIKPT